MDEKGGRSPLDMLNNRNSWSLADDSELLKHLQSLSEKLFSKSRSTLQLLQSFENDVNQTCVAVANVNNRFKALSDTQFIESKVEESPEKEITETKENETAATNPVKEDITEKLKEALDYGINVLESQYDVIAVTDSDSESEEPPEILLKARNPYMSRRLPYIIGTDNFNKYDHLGLDSTSSEEEDGNEEEEENESEKETEESKITPQAVRIETDLHRPLTQVIRISSSDSEDSDVSLPQNECNNSGSIPKYTTNDTPTVKQELRTPTQQTPFSFADHLNATLQNASSRMHRDTDLPSHDDIFSPPPFPSKDVNSYSSDEEKNDESSDDMVISKSQAKKSVPNYNLQKAQPSVEDSDDNDEWMTASSHDADAYSGKAFSTKPTKVHIPADALVSRHPPAASETSQTVTNSSDTRSNVDQMSAPTTKNVQNKKIINLINAELAAKRKVQKNPTPNDEGSSSDDDGDQFQRSLISSRSRKKDDLVDEKAKTKPSLFDDEAKPVRNVSSTPKSKTALDLFDDEDDDAVSDLFGPAAKTNVAKVDDRKTSKGLFDDSDDLFGDGARSYKPVDKTAKPSAIGNMTAIKKDLFGDDSDSGDDIFAIINSQKKSNVLSPKPAESSNKNTAKSTSVFKADDSTFPFGKKEADAVPGGPQKKENSFEDGKTESVANKRTLDVKKSNQKSENETRSPKDVAKKAALFGDDDDDLFLISGRSTVAEAPKIPQTRDNVNESKSSVINKSVTESRNTAEKYLNNENDSKLPVVAKKNVDAAKKKTLFEEVESIESENDESIFNVNVRESRNRTQDLEKNTAKNENSPKKHKNLFEDTDESESEFDINKNRDSIFSKSVLETGDKVDESKKTTRASESDVVKNKDVDSSNSKQQEFTGRFNQLEKDKDAIDEKLGESYVNERATSYETFVKPEILTKDVNIEDNKFYSSSSPKNTLNKEIDPTPEEIGAIGIVANRNDDKDSNIVERISKTFGAGDERDGNLFAKSTIQEEVQPVKPIPGKLTAGRGLNINVNALLPGSNWSAISKQQKEEASSPLQEPSTNSEPQESAPNLSNVTKDRAKISTKRRPPSRRARINKISENSLFPATADSDEHVDDSSRKNIDVSTNSERLSSAIAKQDEKASFDDLFRNDEEESKESFENTFEAVKKVNQEHGDTKVTTNTSVNVDRSAGLEEYLKTDTESKESSSDTSYSSTVKNDQTQVKPNDDKPALSLTGIIKDRVKLPNRRPPTRKQPIQTNAEQITRSKLENISSTVKPPTTVDVSSLPSSNDLLAPNKPIDINKLFAGSDDDDDDDLFSKLIVKNKPERKDSDLKRSTDATVTSVKTPAGAEFDDKNIVDVKQKAVSLTESKKGRTDLFSSAKVASSSSGTGNVTTKSNVTSSGPPVTKGTSKYKVKDLFAEDSDEESDIFATISSKSKTTSTAAPQTKANVAKEVKNVKETKSSPSSKSIAHNKPKVDLFGEEEDELFSKPKKSFTTSKSALSKRKSLFDDNDDDDDDLFGVKASAGVGKPKDSLQKPKIAPSTEKQRVVKLRSETVIKDPLSGK